MSNTDIEDAWDYLTINGIATDDELVLVTSINGHRLETLEDVLYVRAGYRSFTQASEYDQ